jgi:argininosuccinate lyase
MNEGSSSPIAGNGTESATSAKHLLIAGLHSANLAYALALERSSAMSRGEGRALVRGLLDLRLDGFDIEVGKIPRALESTLQRRLGAPVAWLNADRSRRETVGVAFLIAIRKRILDLARAHLCFAETAIELADQHRETTIEMPATQSSGTISTLGYCLLTYVYPAFRDLERLQHCFRSFNSSPCGAGQEATGARLPIDRDWLRALLGFDEVRTHAGDAVWQADGPIELMAAIVALLVNLNRLTDDLRLWSHAADLIDVAWVRALASGLLAKVPALAVLGKEAEGNAEGCVVVANELCAAFDGAVRAIELLTAFIDRGAKNAAINGSPGIYSAGQSDLKEVILIRGGIDCESAQRIAEEIDRLIGRREIKLQSLTSEAIDFVAVQVIGRRVSLTSDDLAMATEPERMIGARGGPGGTAPGRVLDMITECRARLVRENLWVATAGERLAKSEMLLLTEAREAAGL